MKRDSQFHFFFFFNRNIHSIKVKKQYKSPKTNNSVLISTTQTQRLKVGNRDKESLNPKLGSNIT